MKFLRYYSGTDRVVPKCLVLVEFEKDSHELGLLLASKLALVDIMNMLAADLRLSVTQTIAINSLTMSEQFLKNAGPDRTVVVNYDLIRYTDDGRVTTPGEHVLTNVSPSAIAFMAGQYRATLDVLLVVDDGKDPMLLSPDQSRRIHDDNIVQTYGRLKKFVTDHKFKEVPITRGHNGHSGRTLYDGWTIADMELTMLSNQPHSTVTSIMRLKERPANRNNVYFIADTGLTFNV